jgi:hypothetical protein
MLNIPGGARVQGVYFGSSEKNQSPPTLFLALFKINMRPGFGLYSHQQALKNTN